MATSAHSLDHASGGPIFLPWADFLQARATAPPQCRDPCATTCSHSCPPPPLPPQQTPCTPIGQHPRLPIACLLLLPIHQPTPPLSLLPWSPLLLLPQLTPTPTLLPSPPPVLPVPRPTPTPTLFSYLLSSHPPCSPLLPPPSSSACPLPTPTPALFSSPHTPLQLCLSLGLPVNDTWLMAGQSWAGAARAVLDDLAMRGGPTARALHDLNKLTQVGS